MVGSASAAAGYDSEYSDSPSYTSTRASARGGGGGSQARPKKRFIWPEELHRDFIAAVFDVGLKSADPRAIASLLPDAESQGGTAIRIKSTLQKMRNFRYQMRKASNGGSSDMPGEGDHYAGALGDFGGGGEDALAAATANSRDGVGDGRRDVLAIPEGVQRLINWLDGGQLRRNVELVAQCVQVQASIQQALSRAMENQRRLQEVMMNKVSDMGMPYGNGSGSSSALAPYANLDTHAHRGLILTN
ncbi:hypothetical protein JKP88DRAFT_194649, partial [Tribonema minus]